MGVPKKSVAAFITTSSEETRSALTSLGPNNQYIVSSTLDTTESSSDGDAGLRHLRSNLINPVYGKAMADIVSAFDWHFVSVVQSEDTNSIDGAKSFFDRLTETDSSSTVCPGQHITLPQYMTAQQAQDVVRTLSSLDGANVVVLFTSRFDTDLLMQATKDLDREVINKLHKISLKTININ